MTDSEIAYMALVLGAFAVFMVTVAYGMWCTATAPRSKARETADANFHTAQPIPH
jgi:hypothetical protein